MKMEAGTVQPRERSIADTTKAPPLVLSSPKGRALD